VLTFGELAELVELDMRQHRADHPRGEGAQVRSPAAIDLNTTMLGPEQEQWLVANLDASTPGWNVLAESLRMGEMEPSARRLPASGARVPDWPSGSRRGWRPRHGHGGSSLYVPVNMRYAVTAVSGASPVIPR